MDTERLWWDARAGFSGAPPHGSAAGQSSVWQSEEEPEGVGESGEETVEEQGEDEEEDEEDEKASDTLL